MAVWSVTGPTIPCGFPILPGDRLVFSVTINTWNMTPYYDFWWGVGTTEYPPQANEIQTPGPFPKTFDYVVAAPSQSTSIIFRGHEYGVPGDVDYVFPITVDTTTKPSIGAYPCRNCETWRATLDGEIDNGTSWSVEFLDAYGNTLGTGDAVISPSPGAINRQAGACQKHYPFSITNIPTDVDSVRITASNPNGTTTYVTTLETPTWNVSITADKTTVQAAGDAVVLSLSIAPSSYPAYLQSFTLSPLGVFLPEVRLDTTPYTASFTVHPTETTKYKLTVDECCVVFDSEVTVKVPQTYHAILTPTIPENWRINKAVLVLKAKPSDDPAVNTGLLSVRIYGGPAFTGQRPRRITDARVEWRLAGWTADEWYQSPDISCVLAEMRARGFTTIYLSPCSGSSWYQAYDSGDGTSPKLQVWASLVRSHTSTGGLVVGGSAEVRKRQSSLILNRFAISSTPDVREPTASLILNRFAVHTETREPAAGLILNRFAIGTEVREPVESLILNRFAIRARQSSLILNRFAIRSPQSSLILNRFAIFYPDRHHVVCRNLATGEVRELGVVDADASPLQLADVALAPGTYEVWTEREGLYWKAARKPTVRTIAITDGPPILNPLPVALDLAATVSRAQTTITWTASHAVAGWETRWGLWFAAASPVDTSGPPAQRVAAMPTQLTYQATRSQQAAEYVAVAAIAAGGQRGLQAELHLPWNTTPPVSPPNQTAMAGWPRAI